jgi:hypothetical protein
MPLNPNTVRTTMTGWRACRLHIDIGGIQPPVGDRMCLGRTRFPVGHRTVILIAALCDAMASRSRF